MNSLVKQAKEIIKKAEKVGIDTDPIFCTTYHLLLTEIEMLEGLEKSFREEGVTVEKEYVKGRKNLYISPSVDKYAKVSDSALKKIVALDKMLSKYVIPDDDDFDEFNA